MTKYKLTWITEDDPDEDWLSGEQHSHSYYCNNKTALFKRYLQAKVEQGYDFEIYVRNENRYCLTDIKLE